jgi:uncharacterized protein YggE
MADSVAAVSDDQRIVVRGEAERQAPADLAALTVLVQVDDVEQATAVARASDLAGAVDAVLDLHAGALGPRQATVVVVQPTTRWVDGEEQRTGWRATRSSSLDVTDLDQVSPLLVALVAAGAIVRGPWWRLRRDHPVLAEVRAAAAADAHARAMTYASALGARVGRVDWVAEPGLRLPPRGMGGAGPQPTASVRAGGAAEAALEVAPAELTVTAAVEVGFAIGR